MGVCVIESARGRGERVLGAGALWNKSLSTLWRCCREYGAEHWRPWAALKVLGVVGYFEFLLLSLVLFGRCNSTRTLYPTYRAYKASVTCDDYSTGYPVLYICSWIKRNIEPVFLVVNTSPLLAILPLSGLQHSYPTPHCASVAWWVSPFVSVL